MFNIRRLLTVVLAVLLTATACGASETVETTASQPEPSVSTPADVSLQLTSELDTTEMFDTRTGQVTSLGDVVTGDRPVLLWYWAPN